MRADVWVTVKECLNVAGLPTSEPAVRCKLEKLTGGNQSLVRKRAGTKAVEFNICALPVEVRAELLKRRNQVETSHGLVAIPEKTQVGPVRTHLWKCWEQANEEQRQCAHDRVSAVLLMVELINSGLTVRAAADVAADKLALSANTLRRWYGKAQKHPRSDWGPALLDTRLLTHSAAIKTADFDENAWEFIKADYLRVTQPTLTSCYERLKLSAKKNKWVIPSYDTVRRRIEDIPIEQRVLLREGEHALSQLYPAQRRTVANLSAMEWINGDGYKHNVWVLWHDGTEQRPKTWFWQDVYSRKILGYYTDISENTDSIRYSLLDVISKYGKPKELTIDNTRAAANKAMTGGKKNRYRFKVKEDDPIGIIPMLGIELHWTSVSYGRGNGRAKPVERVFGVGGLGEYVDKHPLCAGAFTGPNVNEKPDYQYTKNERGNKTRPISVETFKKALEEGVAMFNAIVGRETEICAGKLSFDAAFDASYAQSIHEYLPPEQLRMLMLCSEATSVRHDGRFVLKSGGKIQARENWYKADELLGARLKKVVVRFDPRNLHGEVHCYDLDGKFVCTAVCDEPAAFGDTQSAREYKRLRTQKVKATKKAASAQKQMDVMELTDLLAKPDSPQPPSRPVVSIFTAGNTVKKVQAAEDEEELTEIDLAFQRQMDELYKSQE